MTTVDSTPALTLTLLRHAKSSWGDPDATDHQRTLNKRGKADAPEMATRLKARQHSIGQIVCSDAVRTRETAALMLPVLQLDSADLTLDARIYEASLQDLLDVIANQHSPTLFIIGHNPGLEMLCHCLAPGEVPRMPTCAIAAFTLKGERWDTALDAVLAGQKADLFYYDYPKNDYPKNRDQ